MRIEFSPQVSLLLLQQSKEKVQMQYDANPYTWSMPKISSRPPYYMNPRFVQSYPLI